jgi:hypothetical protein
MSMGVETISTLVKSAHDRAAALLGAQVLNGLGMAAHAELFLYYLTHGVWLCSSEIAEVPLFPE